MRSSKTKLESFVETYLKQVKRRSAFTSSEIALIEKGRQYIQWVKDGGCCADDELIVIPQDNQFTNTIYTLLNQIGYNTNRQSFDRTLADIDNFLSCCGAYIDGGR